MILWIIEHVPTIFFHISIFLSIAVLAIIEFIPLKSLAAAQIQLARLISIAVLVFAILCEGVAWEEEKWTTKMHEQEVIAQTILKESEASTLKLKQDYDKKVDFIKKDTDEQIKKFKSQYAKELDNKCKLTVDAARVLWAASQNRVSGSSSGDVNGTANVEGNTGTKSDSTTNTDGSQESNVKASDAVSDVIENYGTYYQMREKLIWWQKWYSAEYQIYKKNLKNY